MDWSLYVRGWFACLLAVSADTLYGGTAKLSPYAKPGHYNGKTSQMEKVEFVVSPNGRQVTSGTWRYSLSCQPIDRISPNENFHIVHPYRLNPDGSWSAKEADINTSPDKTVSLVSTLKITKSGTARGYFKVTSSFVQDGTAFTCSNGTVTWTAKRS